MNKHTLIIACLATLAAAALAGCISNKNTPAIDPDYVAALRAECDNLASENSALRAALRAE